MPQFGHLRTPCFFFHFRVLKQRQAHGNRGNRTFHQLALASLEIPYKIFPRATKGYKFISYCFCHWIKWALKKSYFVTTVVTIIVLAQVTNHMDYRWITNLSMSAIRPTTLVRSCGHYYVSTDMVSVPRAVTAFRIRFYKDSRPQFLKLHELIVLKNRGNLDCSRINRRRGRNRTHVR